MSAFASGTTTTGCLNSSFPRAMKHKMSGTDVACLQRLLNATAAKYFKKSRGWNHLNGPSVPPLQVDGYFGAITEGHLRVAQDILVRPLIAGTTYNYKAYVDGIAGAKTISWLKNYMEPTKFKPIFP